MNLLIDPDGNTKTLAKFGAVEQLRKSFRSRGNRVEFVSPLNNR